MGVHKASEIASTKDVLPGVQVVDHEPPSSSFSQKGLEEL